MRVASRPAAMQLGLSDVSQPPVARDVYVALVSSHARSSKQAPCFRRSETLSVPDSSTWHRVTHPRFLASPGRPNTVPSTRSTMIHSTDACDANLISQAACFPSPNDFQIGIIQCRRHRLYAEFIPRIQAQSHRCQTAAASVSSASKVVSQVEAFVFCCVLRQGEARFVLITDQSVRQTVP